MTLTRVGDCAPLFRAARRALAPRGVLALSLEERGRAGFGLGAGGRFAHSEAYLRAAARAAGLRVVALDRGVLRLQRGAPVAGIYAALAVAPDR